MNTPFPFSDDSLTPVLVSASVKGSLLILGILCLTALCKRTAPARRHLAWASAIVGLLLLPLLSVQLPQWRPEVIPPAYVATQQLFAPTKTPASPPPVATSSAPAEAFSETAVRDTPVNWPSIALWVWGLGAAAFLFRMAAGLIGARRTLGRAKPVTEESIVSLTARAVGGSLGVWREVRLLLGSRGSMPAVVGHRRPAVILPEDAAQWPPEQLRAVLVHEMAHVRRSDWLLGVVAGVVRAVYWFNPLVWLAVARMRAESELACDDLVVASGVGATEYAGELLKVAKLASTRGALTPMSVGMARSPRLEGRIRAILDMRRGRRGFTRPGAMIALAVALVAVGSLAALRPAVAQGSGTDRKVSHLDPSGSAAQAEGYRATVFGDVTVELRAIGESSYAFDDDRAWTPAGAVFPAIIRGPLRFHQSEVLADTAFKRYLLITVRSPHNLSGSTVGYVPELYREGNSDLISNGFDGQCDDLELEAGKPMDGVIPVSFKRVVGRFNYRFGIAVGEWRTETITPNTLRPATGTVRESRNGYHYGPAFTLGGRPAIGYQDKAGKNYTLYLAPAKWKLGLDARRLVAVDAQGRQHELPGHGGTYDGMPSGEVDPDQLREIKEFHFQTRRYQWVEFKDIPAQASIQQDREPIRVGAATGVAPGFSHALSNGYEVSVAGVVGSSLQNGRWRFGSTTWRADGKILAKRPMPPLDHSYDQKSWPAATGPTIAYFSVQPTSARKGEEVSVAVETLTDVVSPEWVGGKHRFNTMAGLVSRMEAFPGTDKTADFRVGVAAGAWRTVATQAIDFKARPYVKDKAREEDVSVLLSDTPMVAVRGSDGKFASRQWIDQPLGMVAVRLVGVDAQGKEHALTPAGRAYQGVEVYSFSAMRDSSLQGYNDLKLWQMRELRLQTRPFEWTTFKGVAVRPTD